MKQEEAEPAGGLPAEGLCQGPGVGPLSLAKLVETIESSSGLPEACRKMLTAVLPTSLLVAAEERHEHQRLAVCMLEEVFLSAEAELQAAMAADEAALAALDFAEGGLGPRLLAAEQGLAAAAEAAIAKKLAHDAAVLQVTVWEKALAGKQAEQAAAGAGAAEAQRLRAGLLGAIGGAFRALLWEGAGEPGQDWSAEKASKHLDELLSFAGILALDESMLSALPAICAIPPAHRGEFDRLVMQKLEQMLNDKVSSLEAELRYHGEAYTARSAALGAAASCRSQAEAGVHAAAAALTQAQAELSAAEARVLAARQALESGPPERSRAAEALGQSRAALEAFRTQRLQPFLTLLRGAPAGGNADAAAAAAC